MSRKQHKEYAVVRIEHLSGNLYTVREARERAKTILQQPNGVPCAIVRIIAVARKGEPPVEFYKPKQETE